MSSDRPLGYVDGDGPAGEAALTAAEASTPPARRRGLWPLLVAQTLSALGDSFSYVAIPLLVLHATGSVAQMGVVTALGGAATLVTGVFAGVVVDRFDRRRLLVGCDLARLLLYGSIPLVWLAGPRPWLLYLVLPLASAFGMVFRVAHVTVVPGLVPADQITRANSRLFAASATAYLVGPALAGLLSGRFGPTTAIAVDAATFAVSAAVLLLLRLRPVTAATGPEGDRPMDVLLAGARFIAGHPILRPMTVLLTVLSSLTFGLTDVVIYRLKHDLGQSDGTVGYVLAVGIVGTLLGSVAVTRLRRRYGFAPTWTGAWALCGVAMAGIGLAGRVPVVAAAATAVLGCSAVAGIASMSLRQEVTPAPLLGRVTSAFWTLHSALTPLGAAALTAAAAGYGSAATLIAAGALCTATAATALCTPLFRTSSADEAGPDVTGRSPQATSPS
ncbi:MFS transporter [Catellatospora coxensis]|uniref:MFS transporter n=1 Tax=Catellatospora coxensis TaxID=310354 RepID=A0A8J3P4V8_9ACTN|nr:MFS transporter [Catellatospora coxensis]GIG04111.1 MFS transporter [Catellatospora coxensis]